LGGFRGTVSEPEHSVTQWVADVKKVIRERDGDDRAVEELSADTFAGLRIGELCGGAMVVSKCGDGHLKTKIKRLRHWLCSSSQLFAREPTAWTHAPSQPLM